MVLISRAAGQPVCRSALSNHSAPKGPLGLQLGLSGDSNLRVAHLPPSCNKGDVGQVLVAAEFSKQFEVSKRGVCHADIGYAVQIYDA